MNEQSRGVRPWAAIADPLDERRRELFALAAPVFRAHGYRGATIAALAHACHLSPAGLYHYFGSKAEFATYLVTRPHLEWRTVHVDSARDGREQLRELVELASRELPTFLLALSLADELGMPGMDRRRAALFAEGEVVVGRYVAAANPGLGPDSAREAGRSIIAVMVGSEAIGDNGTTVQRRVGRILAGAGIDLGGRP